MVEEHPEDQDLLQQDLQETERSMEVLTVHPPDPLTSNNEIIPITETGPITILAIKEIEITMFGPITVETTIRAFRI